MHLRSQLLKKSCDFTTFQVPGKIIWLYYLDYIVCYAEYDVTLTGLTPKWENYFIFFKNANKQCVVYLLKRNLLNLDSVWAGCRLHNNILH